MRMIDRGAKVPVLESDLRDLVAHYLTPVQTAVPTE